MDATILLERLGSVLRESILLEGARTLDLERETSSEASNDVRVPELRLNICLVSEVFVQVLATGVGALAFIWATVVLLGGFSTYLHKVDFWVITVIVFIQAAKVVGLNSKTEAKFCAQVPPAFLELGAEHFMPQGQRRQLTGEAVGKQIISYIMKGLQSARDFISFMALLASLLLILPLVAGSSCIALSIFRLVIITTHNYEGNHADANNSNVLRALIFFYALVLAQGGLFILWLCLLLHRSALKDKVCSEYGFQGQDNKNLIDKYIHRTSSSCIISGVLNTINRNLVSFAIDLLQSEYSQDRISAIQVLHLLTSKDAHKARTLSQIQTSPESLTKMLAMLSSKSAIDQGNKVQIAQIVTELASELRLAEIPRALESISSLIDPCLTKLSTMDTIGASDQQSVTFIISDQHGIKHQSNSPNNGAESKPLFIHGLLILLKLADNLDNCKEIYRRKVLFSKIMAPITNKLYKVNEDIAIAITEKSLQVLSKFVSGTAEANRKICKEICSKWLAVKSIYPILTDDRRYNKLKVPAIEILVKLAPVCSTKEISMAGFIDVLQILFFDSVNDSYLRKTAGEALTLLATNKTYCVMIMNGGTEVSENSIVQRLTDMLLDTNTRLYRTAIAQLLMQFFANLSAEQAREYLAPIKTILHEVLKDICNVEPETNLQIQPSAISWTSTICTQTYIHLLNQGSSQNSGGNRHNQRLPQAFRQALSLFVRTLLPANRHNQSHDTDQRLLVAALAHLNRLFNVSGAYYAEGRNRTIRGGSVQGQTTITPMEPSRRKTLVAFLGLAVQMCDKLIISANDFDDAVARIGIPNAGFVEKLKAIIESCTKDSLGHYEGKGPSTDYLLMIKSVTKLCAWVIQTKPGYLRHFQEKNIAVKLKEAQIAMRDLELTVVLTSSADEMASYETFSSVMEDAKLLLARQQLIVWV